MNVFCEPDKFNVPELNPKKELLNPIVLDAPVLFPTNTFPIPFTHNTFLLLII